jgi:hypothetical protein
LEKPALNPLYMLDVTPALHPAGGARTLEAFATIER